MGRIERINAITNESPGKRHTKALANICALIENMKSGSENINDSVIGHSFVQTIDLDRLLDYARGEVMDKGPRSEGRSSDKGI